MRKIEPFSRHETIEVLATIAEYVHALEHIAEAHEGGCEDCRRLAQSALDGVNRDMCRALVLDA